MNEELFESSEGGESIFPLDGTMLAALEHHPDTDREALARIPSLALRWDCFNYLVDVRRRGSSVLAAMAAIVKSAGEAGRRDIGGVSLAGALRLSPPYNIEIGNDLACFYVYVLALTEPDLARYLKSDGEAASALKRAGWKP